ncbi:hypothetical protein GCM10011328_40450 [Hafnia psychrotolerans]|uniref:DUF4942 domain-containing protein n=1 Tax=Hafnia psychrotolerans TaxID=1477018 RepID=A0ABQ1H7L1_9GAMM|nr:hypothetical protein GCM10011328_40450 [Hafnia psychrotolerans]
MDIIEQIEAGTLSLSELVNTLSKDWDYSSLVWSQRYHELTEVVGKAQSFTGPEHDDLLKRLWYERDNGVASIKQGVPSSAEYHQNIPLLRELTEIIRKNPDAATYQQVTKRMLQAISRMYWSLRNRVFAAFSAENFTTIVDENAFNNVVGFLNKHYRLELALNGSWLEKNQEFKQAINVRLPHRDPHYVNMAMWHTYEELCEHENNKTPKGQISISGTEKES